MKTWTTAARVLVAMVMLATLGARPVAAADAPTTQPGAGKVACLDHFYNHEVKAGKQFHYVWDDSASTGFSKFGKVWEEQGAKISKLETAPTSDDLKMCSIYIVANPTPADKAPDKKANFISEPAIGVIEAWVKDGGVLLLMANDPGRCEFEHFNNLATKFGITYDANMRNTAPTNNDRAHAAFSRAKDHFPDHPIFQGIDMIYMKEISSISVKPPATGLFVVEKDAKESKPGDSGAGEGKDVIIAVAKVGKGFVLAVGDPWVYNEYIDQTWPQQGLPVENHKAAVNLAKFLCEQAKPPMSK